MFLLRACCRIISTFSAIAWAVAAVLSVAVPAGGAEVILQTNFETDPRIAGWGNAKPTALNSWTTAESFSPTHSLRVHDGLWYTPIMPMELGSLYSVEFRGKTAGEGLWGPINDPFSEYREGAGWQRNLKVFRDEPGFHDRRIIFQPTTTLAPVFLDDVVVNKLTRAEAATLQDEFFATMPAFTFTPPANRHVHIPQTIQKLKAGQDLKVVMLGDSIVNDTSHSYFEPLVERKYPGSRINVTTSVRGFTGMWWYKEENRLQSYVLDHDPDLVMIGGISHLNDIESVREVIRQIRAASPATEVVLMSEAAGYNDPYSMPELLKPVNPTEPGWRNELYCLAVQEEVEFLDMTRPWSQYIVNSGKSNDWFFRDPIHMNDRGSHVAGRILEAYFSPVINPEPVALGGLAVGAVSLLRRRKRR